MIYPHFLSSLGHQTIASRSRTHYSFQSLPSQETEPESSILTLKPQAPSSQCRRYDHISMPFDSFKCKSVQLHYHVFFAPNIHLEPQNKPQALFITLAGRLTTQNQDRTQAENACTHAIHLKLITYLFAFLSSSCSLSFSVSIFAAALPSTPLAEVPMFSIEYASSPSRFVPLA
jgi:hypothetical protein